MNEIDIRKIDLNLLPVFETLMQERSVSRTAERLHRTQSAISHALERLRQQLQDPLLVRQGADMVPSPYAQHLMAELQPLLRQMAQAMAPPVAFDPASATRTLRIAMRDFLAGLFPDLLHLCREQAPGVRLEWVQAGEQPLAALIEGRLDLFLGPAPMPLPSGIDCSAVGALGWACFMRQGHPALAKWGASAWQRWPHVQVGVADPVRNPVLQAANAQGLQRRVAVSVPLFSAVAPVLAGSDLLATLPRAVMRDQLRFWGLVERPTPMPVAPIDHALYSARRMAGDAGLRWFSAQVRQALAPFLD